MGKFKLGDRVKVKDPKQLRFYKWIDESQSGNIVKVGPLGYTVDFGTVKEIVFGKDMYKVNE